jgi:hypothetical protein
MENKPAEENEKIAPIWVNKPEKEVIESKPKKKGK